MATMMTTGFVLALGTTLLPCAEMTNPLRHDADHRYRLEITVAQKSAIAGDDLPTIFCLSPTLDDRIEVCLGEHQGHAFNFGYKSELSFKAPTDGDHMCRCERPVVLRASQPFCWSMTASVPRVDVSNVDLKGFATILEGVHETGATAESCICVYSSGVPLTIKGKKDHKTRPPKEPSPEALLVTPSH